jgi:hypothetical protein
LFSVTKRGDGIVEKMSLHLFVPSPNLLLQWGMAAQ